MDAVIIIYLVQWMHSGKQSVLRAKKAEHIG